MQYEISIIKSFLKYDEWFKWKDKLEVKDLPKELSPVYSVLHNYHTTSVNKEDLSVGDLANLLFAHKHKDVSYYEGVLANLDKLDVSASTTEVLLKSFYRNKVLKQISLAAYDIAEGKEKHDNLTELFKQLEEGPEELDEEEVDFLENDLEKILAKVVTSPGLRWRLSTMNKMLGSLRKGNFGFLFARPETGKTTFLASEVTFMAEQLADDAGPIIWLNNEQQGEEVLLRLYQASLGWSTAKLLAYPQQAQQQYLARTKNKLQLVDKAQLSKGYIEALCKRHSPSLIVVDQLDAIQGFTADRNDLHLGQIYRWAREIAKQYCPVIGVCQADGTGEGQRWLTMANVSDAKTAKQAHPDWILGIGKTNDMGYENVRYLHLSKNKLHGDSGVTDPALKHGKLEVVIEQDIGRYKDIQ